MSRWEINQRLLVASERGNLNTVLECIRSGANVNVKGPDGWTPLGNAVFYGRTDIVKALIEAGADIKAKNGENKETVLHIALGEFGRLRAVASFLFQLNKIDSIINLKDKDGDTPLHLAADDGNIDIIKTLIDLGADPNIQNKEGWTPLHFTAFGGHVESFKFLINNGANINAKNKEGEYPLDIALDKIRTDCARIIIEFLVNNGVYLNVMDKYGNSPLHYAAKIGNIEIIRSLIDLGVTIDAKNKLGKTPLHVAVARNDHNAAIFLIESGANPYIKDNRGETAFDMIPVEEWKTKIMAAYQNHVAFGKAKEIDDNSAQPVIKRKSRAI